jgi:hypothetical protein
MPKVRALSPEQAKRTLANRFGKRADRLRQIATNKGIRPYRVFLTWIKWDGPDRGEGTDTLVKRIEILPTPRVKSLDNLSFSLFHAGTIPVGSLRVDRISVHRFTEDILLGKAFPDNPLPFGESPIEKHLPAPWEFFYEVVEDGRGDFPAKRKRFRPMNNPVREAGKVHWSIMLERTSEDRSRQDKTAMGTGLE